MNNSLFLTKNSQYTVIKIMITKPKKTPDHLVMIIQLMNIFMTCKDWAGGSRG